MGIWSGIKHAINSTLGTKDFKPLDQIIEGQRTLAASDSVYCVLLSQPIELPQAFTVIGSFVPNKGGSVRILLGLQNNRSSYATLIIQVKKNGVQELYIEQVVAGSTSADWAKDISVEAGAQYEVIICSSVATNVHLNYAELGAHIVDTSLISVVEGE